MLVVRGLERGHVDSEMIIDQIPDYMDRVFYISGPPSFVKDYVQHLMGLGVGEDKIKTKNFIGY